MKRKMLESLLSAIIPTVKEFVLDELRRRDARIDALESQKGATGIRYRGSWEAGVKYERGNFVSDGGSVWHCNEDTTQRPGPGTAWTLAVKRGRDGRDAG